MSATTAPTAAAAMPRGRTKQLPWFSHGLANLVVILVLSTGFWYVFVDPRWSPVNDYPGPFDAVLFWAIVSVVWLGFNLEFFGFDRLTQPWRGLALIAISIGVAIGITCFIGFGYGHFDPTFATSRPLGAGYTAGSLWVLFGFFFYVTSVVNWGNWPFIRSGVAQPWLGIGQIALLFIPTTVMYLVLGIPSVENWGKPLHPIMSNPTIIGWLYAVIVAVVITGLATDNWPYSLAGSPGRVTAVSLVGNFALGTGLYYALKDYAGVLIGSSNTHALGPAITSFAAQFGVCWVLWMILWQNCFANKPDHLRPLANYAVRIVVTFALGTGTFCAYYFWIAGTILHEPTAGGTINGSALGWADWVVLWTLFYVLGFESWGLPKDSDPDQSNSIADSPGTTITETESTVHASGAEPVAPHRVRETT